MWPIKQHNRTFSVTSYMHEVQLSVRRWREASGRRLLQFIRNIPVNFAVGSPVKLRKRTPLHVLVFLEKLTVA